MTSNSSSRIESLDLLKGLVMVLMALDHVRDYFHRAAFFYDPTDPAQTTVLTFLTRWITHFCAPAFSLLAGIAVFLTSRRKSKGELSLFLLKRGIWLIIIDLTLINFAWYFDFNFRNEGLNVIWSLGISMIFLAVLVHLPRTIILVFSGVVIFGHNLLDSIHFEGNIAWSMVHEFGIFRITDDFTFAIGYPIVPWIAVMSLGYYLGSCYDISYPQEKRKKLFNILGFSSIALFLVTRGINLYGNPVKWVQFDNPVQTAMSFMDVFKYPPSLTYLLMTLGPVLIFLANTENFKGRITGFFSTFGRVPFFFYIVHLYLIHLLAMIGAELTGVGWQKMILSTWITISPSLKGYGFSLWVVYLVWLGVIVLLYPLTKKFDSYKQSNKEKWWLSYL